MKQGKSLQRADSMYVARIKHAWYVVCFARDLKKAPLAVQLLGRPLVLYRWGGGKVAALVDRCPHRNVPLSLGEVTEGRIECPYHGWKFTALGELDAIPGLCRDRVPLCRVPSHAVLEQDGLIWVYGVPDIEPESKPLSVPLRPGYARVDRTIQMAGSMFATVENALDVPHTAFLHRNLFRGRGEPSEITCSIRGFADRIEIEYLGEHPPRGVLARLLIGTKGEVVHRDRFILPSTTQVEYRCSGRGHLTTFFCTPLDDFVTRVFAVVQFKLGLPVWMYRFLGPPLVMQVIRQDMRILRVQTETLERFGRAEFTSSQLDMIGNKIWQLMRRAERDEIRPCGRDACENHEEWSKEFTLIV